MPRAGRSRLFGIVTKVPSQGYNIFCHLLADGQMAAQHDGPAALGLYGTERWRSGDWIVDVHRIDGQTEAIAPDRLAVGAL